MISEILRTIEIIAVRVSLLCAFLVITPGIFAIIFDVFLWFVRYLRNSMFKMKSKFKKFFLHFKDMDTVHNEKNATLSRKKPLKTSKK